MTFFPLPFGRGAEEKKRGERKEKRGGETSFQLGLREQDVPLHFRVVFHERELPRERPWVFPLDVEGARPGGGEELDEERGSLFGAGHFVEEGSRSRSRYRRRKKEEPPKVDNRTD